MYFAIGTEVVGGMELVSPAAPDQVLPASTAGRRAYTSRRVCSSLFRIFGTTILILCCGLSKQVDGWKLWRATNRRSLKDNGSSGALPERAGPIDERHGFGDVVLLAIVSHGLGTGRNGTVVVHDQITPD
jgi:hypothetical protein